MRAHDRVGARRVAFARALVAAQQQHRHSRAGGRRAGGGRRRRSGGQWRSGGQRRARGGGRERGSWGQCGGGHCGWRRRWRWRSCWHNDCLEVAMNLVARQSHPAKRGQRHQRDGHQRPNAQVPGGLAGQLAPGAPGPLRRRGLLEEHGGFWLRRRAGGRLGAGKQRAKQRQVVLLAVGPAGRAARQVKAERGAIGGRRAGRDAAIEQATGFSTIHTLWSSGVQCRRFEPRRYHGSKLPAPSLF
jgi:hypothetical protein